MEFYADIIEIGNEILECARDAKKGVIFVPFTNQPKVNFGDTIRLKLGDSHIDFKVTDLEIHSSEEIGTDHPKILTLHVENLTSQPHKTTQATSMITIGTLNGQQVQVGNSNSQNVNITIEQLAKQIAATNDPKAKGLLKSLLENATVGSLIGVGTSALISIL